MPPYSFTLARARSTSSARPHPDFATPTIGTVSRPRRTSDWRAGKIFLYARSPVAPKKTRASEGVQFSVAMGIELTQTGERHQPAPLRRADQCRPGDAISPGTASRRSASVLVRMRPLVAVRQRTPFDARFVAKSPLFWALARAGELPRGARRFPRAVGAGSSLRGGDPRALRRRHAPTPKAPPWPARRALDVRRHHHLGSARADATPLMARSHERARLGGLSPSEIRAPRAPAPRRVRARPARSSGLAAGSHPRAGRPRPRRRRRRGGPRERPRHHQRRLAPGSGGATRDAGLRSRRGRHFRARDLREPRVRCGAGAGRGARPRARTGGGRSRARGRRGPGGGPRGPFAPPRAERALAS